jgi:hypothetical protein
MGGMRRFWMAKQLVISPQIRDQIKKIPERDAPGQLKDGWMRGLEPPTLRTTI